jgi:hypothetical protein
MTIYVILPVNYPYYYTHTIYPTKSPCQLKYLACMISDILVLLHVMLCVKYRYMVVDHIQGHRNLIVQKFRKN